MFSSFLLSFKTQCKGRVSLSDGLISYSGHILAESYPFAKIQSVYSTAPADWAKKEREREREREGGEETYVQ